jgi:gamma-glutamylcyclotransferase (GGCT)/AIG2-like uncharacterized protein YtfP
MKHADSPSIAEKEPLSEGGELLFVYGTLCRAAGNGPHPLLGGARFLGEAAWRGELYRVDWYPGAVEGGDGEMVRGELYLLVEPAATLTALDDYEECGPAGGQEGEYRRVVTRVMRPDGREVAAWIYLYNRPVEGLEKIASGDFRTVAEEGKHG